MDGMRRCLEGDFNSLYIVNLRGDIRKNMLSKGAAREGGNIFESGSMNGIAISFLVKNPESKELGKIRYFDIGDDLTSVEKKRKLSSLVSIEAIKDEWVNIIPNDHADWLRQRDAGFSEFIASGDKQGRESRAVFDNFSLGIATNRDAWAVNYSKEAVLLNMKRMIETYESDLAKYMASGASNPDEHLSLDSSKMNWSFHLKKRFQARRRSAFSKDKARSIIYRPFSKQWIYYDKIFNEYTYQSAKLFGDADGFSNLAISVSGTGARSGFSALMIDRLVSGDMVEKGQCFPLSLIGGSKRLSDDLFKASLGSDEKDVCDGITDVGLKHFQEAYPGETITKEDLFFYVYGLLHSEEYRSKYADNLSKELPRIPRVKTAADFWAFSSAGRELGDLHVNYETVEPYPVTIKQGDLRLADIKNPEAFYRVTKWAFGKAGKEKDKTTVIYNANITMQDIPLQAYDYVVNGKPALEWVMERQVVKTDKDSGIENDANRYAIETMNNPAYPLELFQRVISVSLRTMEIVRGLPKLEVMA